MMVTVGFAGDSNYSLSGHTQEGYRIAYTTRIGSRSCEPLFNKL